MKITAFAILIILSISPYFDLSIANEAQGVTINTSDPEYPITWKNLNVSRSKFKLSLNTIDKIDKLNDIINDSSSNTSKCIDTEFRTSSPLTGSRLANKCDEAKEIINVCNASSTIDPTSYVDRAALLAAIQHECDKIKIDLINAIHDYSIEIRKENTFTKLLPNDGTIQTLLTYYSTRNDELIDYEKAINSDKPADDTKYFSNSIKRTNQKILFEKYIKLDQSAVKYFIEAGKYFPAKSEKENMEDEKKERIRRDNELAAKGISLGLGYGRLVKEDQMFSEVQAKYNFISDRMNNWPKKTPAGCSSDTWLSPQCISAISAWFGYGVERVKTDDDSQGDSKATNPFLVGLALGYGKSTNDNAPHLPVVYIDVAWALFNGQTDDCYIGVSMDWNAVSMLIEKLGNLGTVSNGKN